MKSTKKLGEFFGSVLIEGDGADLFNLDLTAYVHAAEEGGYWAEIPALPGCMTQGETMGELMENLDDAVQGWLSVQTREALMAIDGTFAKGFDELSSTLDPHRQGYRVLALQMAA